MGADRARHRYMKGGSIIKSSIFLKVSLETLKGMRCDAGIV